MKAVMPGISGRYILSCVLCALMSQGAMAHTSLGEYVQHRYILDVSSKYTELTVELTFNGEPAEAERAAMDTDKDGTISRDERKAYIAQWEKSGEDRIRLLCNGTEIPVTFLYAPGLDLGGDRGVNHHPVIVRLKFFADTPEALAPGNPVRIESSLQREAPALVALEVDSDAAAPFTIEPKNGDTMPALKTGSRVFEIQCPKFNRETKTNQPSTKPGTGE